MPGAESRVDHKLVERSASQQVFLIPCAGNPRAGNAPSHVYQVLGPGNDGSGADLGWLGLAEAVELYPVSKIVVSNGSDLCPPCERAGDSGLDASIEAAG